MTMSRVFSAPVPTSMWVGEQPRLSTFVTFNARYDNVDTFKYFHVSFSALPTFENVETLFYTKGTRLFNFPKHPQDGQRDKMMKMPQIVQILQMD